MNPSPETIISIIKEHAKTYPHETILRYKEDSIFKAVSWQALEETICLLGCALIDMGVKMGDRVALLSENRPEWAYVDLAALYCGAVTVPIYATNTSKDIGYILKNSAAEIIFVSTKERLEKVLPIAKETPLKRIISFQEMPSIDPLVITFNNFLLHGRKKLDLYKDALEKRSVAVQPDDLVTIIYTSGSTGPPKGVMLTNRNFVSNCRSCAEAIRIGPKDRYLSFLPLSHVFERMAGHYMFLIQRGQIAYAQSRETILEDARLISPTLIYGVPRFFEKVYAEILNKAVRASAIRRNIFFWGYRVGRACMLMKLRKRRVPFYLILQKLLVTNAIARKLKRSFGGSLRFFVSGGAPLSKEVANFFLSFDILVLEGYGLTESSPVIAVNTERDYKIGTVGKPVKDVDVQIASDGEILARGSNIMKGYYNLYEDTDSAVKDGWLYTGDIGHFDKDGFLVITDRKKDIIITSGGKNIAPSEAESVIKADRYIDDILIYGDKKKFLCALVIPNQESLKRYAAFKGIRHKNIKGLVNDERVHNFIRRRIEEKQKDMPNFARIKKFVILDKELTQDAGELTPTLKIKRKVVTHKYKNILDKLYEEDIK